MAIIKFHDFSGFLQSRTTRLLRPVNELSRAINVEANTIGGIQKRLGYSRYGTTVEASQNVLGVHGYYRLNGDSYLLAAVGTTLYRYNAGSWTAISSVLASSSKYEMATFIDEVFITGYNESTRTFDTVRNLDATSLTSTNNLSGANNARFVVVFRQRLYLISLSSRRRSAFQYSDVPTSSGTVITWPSGNIEEVRTDDGEDLNGVGELGNRLVLFKENSVHEWNESTIIQTGKIGTTSHRSIVNSNPYLYFFSRSQGKKGFYRYEGGSPKLISGKIQSWVDGIADSTLGDIIGFKKGDLLIWFVGTITLGQETFSNSAIVYNVSTNVWSIDQYDDTFRCATYFRDSSTERPYIGVSDGDVHQIAIAGDTQYTDNGTAIAALFRTTKLDFGATEDEKQISKSIFFCEQAQGLQIRGRMDDGRWESLGMCTKTVNSFSGLSSKGFYLEIEGSESSGNPPFIFEGLSLDVKTFSSFE